MDHPMAAVDPETAFLASKRQTGNEWELFKENVRPLKKGRNVELLNESLRSQTDNTLKKSLVDKRRRLIEGIDEYNGEDPLHPWLECIKWVQECFPAGGECSGIVPIYEQCVRKFWHDERYKGDLRYLKVWMEYAENCADAGVIYRFLEANQIGQNHSVYYISYALYLESKHKTKAADEIFNLGIARKAMRAEKLEASYRKFLARSVQRSRVSEEESTDSSAPSRTFGTILARGETRKQPIHRAELSKKREATRTDSNSHIAVFNDVESRTRHQLDAVKSGGDMQQSWHVLGTRSGRNKENTSVPCKWTTYKKTGSGFRPAVPVSHLEVFVDDECCTELPSSETSSSSESSALQLRHIESRNMKREAELLKENPLRNFPLNSLPR